MKLVVVADIFDQPAPDICVSACVPHVSDVLRFTLGDLCQTPGRAGEDLHHDLVHRGGFDRAAAELGRQLPAGCVGIGYSAGGTALWRAAAAGLQLVHLFCLSSTRLRELAPISVPNHVFFGALDPGRPGCAWQAAVPGGCTVFADVDHLFYLRPDGAEIRHVGQIMADRLSGCPTGKVSPS